MTDTSKRILLAHSNILGNDPKQTRKKRPYPPLATIQAAAILRNDGFQVALFDPTFHGGLTELQPILDRFQPRIVIVYEDAFNFITKMCLIHMRRAAQIMCQAAGAAGAVTLVAGPDATDHPLEYLQNGADYVLTGEADRTVLEVCRVLSRAGNPAAESVSGLAAELPGGMLLATDPRPLAENLDQFPMPAWDLIDIEPYRQTWKDTHGLFSLNLVSSRGCPFACRWCAKPIWGNHYAQRSADCVAAEMAWVEQHFQPDHIWFADDIFGHDAAWLANFEMSVKDRNIQTPYTIQTRADLLSQTVIERLHGSGCRTVWLGAESGSPRILDAMNKGITVDQVRQAVANLKGAGIRAALFLQFGYPGETLEDIRATIGLMRETCPDDIGISVTYPLPGTEFFHSVETVMGDQTHWRHSADLAMLFQGAYTTPFYRKLHDVLHDELALRHRLAEPGTGTTSGTHTLIRRVMDGWLTLVSMEATHRRNRADGNSRGRTE